MSQLLHKIPIDMFKIGILSLSIKPINIDKFCQKLWSFAKQAKEADSKLILLPEISYTPIITAMNDNILNATSFLEEEIKKIAKHYSLYICGGSGLYRINEKIYNQSFLATPDGTIIYQTKVNLTESEKRQGITEGHLIKILTTPFVKMAICICYDIEFPELVRQMVLEGVDLILIPTHTETPFGKHRVQFCAQARAIENHIFIASASLVGKNGPPSRPTGSGRSVLYSPIDSGFTSNGIVAQSRHNQEHLLFANVDLKQLYELRQNCSTSPLRDYRSFTKRQIQFEYCVI